MPNAWDAGSAVILADVGFPAIATTSAGIAFSLARPDYDDRHAHLALTRKEMLERARQIVRAVDVPVSGDLEAGYGDAPHDVAATVRFAIDAGLSGANIEDKNPRTGLLYDEALAVERIAAARAAIDAAGVPFVLTARTDGFLTAMNGAMEVSIRRSNLFRQAGADCLFPAGAGDIDVVKTLVREVDGPVNIVTGLGRARLDPSVLIDAGVRRVSLGGAIARSALAFVRHSAEELRDRGSIHFADLQMSQSELNALFARRERRPA
jgi:2-methylisocitrate lyase-like PEP mutase family enzyme